MARRSPRTFGTIRRLPSGNYQASYVGPDGERHLAPTTFLARVDADGWLALRQGEVVTGKWLPPTKDEVKPVDRLTFGRYAEDWLPGRALAPRTAKHYRELLDRLILPAFGERDMFLTPTEVRAWHATIAPGTPTLRAHAYALLKAIFTTAVDDDIISTANPCRIKGAGNTKRAVKIRPATVDELAVIVDSVPAKYRLMVLLASWTSLRFGELTELRRKDIDPRKGVVHVRRGVTHPGGVCTVGDPKSEAGKRDVAIPPHLLPAVVAHLDEHTGRGREALLFPPTQGGCHLLPASLYRVYYPAREKAGRPDLRFHDLRHTGATMAAHAGATLADLMSRLGHSTAFAALRYQHAVSGRDAEIAQRLSKLATVTDLDAKRQAKKKTAKRELPSTASEASSKLAHAGEGQVHAV